MQIYPVLPKIQENELLVSYLIRLAKANGKEFSKNSKKSMFPTSWSGAGLALDNVAQQLGIDVIDLLLDHTVYGWYQLFMTRTEHKNGVRNIFTRADSILNRDKKKHVKMPDDLGEVYACSECIAEDCKRVGVKYIRRDLQLSQEWCMEHSRSSWRGDPNVILGTDIKMMPKMRIPYPSEMPTGLDKDSYNIALSLCNERILINNDDAMLLIESQFNPSEFFTHGTSLDLYNKDTVFSRSSYTTQIDYLSDAYGYYESSKEKGFRLDGLHNLMTGLLAECYPTIDKLKAAMPPESEIYRTLVVRAASMGFELLTQRVQPIVRIRDVITGNKFIVSPYEILDGETKERNKALEL